MEETAQLVPPRNPLGEATLPSPPQTPLSLFAPSGLRITWLSLSARSLVELARKRRLMYEQTSECSRRKGIFASSLDVEFMVEASVFLG
ncbi:MAG: hypothetical protein HYW48_02940 [Deltaproteobacteria bacterium]|nr:hypothetical protein [Deltaproteobacteria bacterium]